MGHPVSPGQPPDEHVLAAYGTLRPGEENHHVVAGLRGRWLTGTVRGRVGVNRSGPYRGFPAFVFDHDSPPVPVAVLVSEELPAHWARLDDFEGPGYRRTVRTVALAADPIGPTCRANVYELVEPSDLEAAPGNQPG